MLIYLTFEFSRVTNTRGHAYKLYKSHCNYSTHSRFFAKNNSYGLKYFTYLY